MDTTPKVAWAIATLTENITAQTVVTPVVQAAAQPTVQTSPQMWTLEEIRAEAVAEVNRLAAVHEILAQFPKLGAQAIEEGWDEGRCALAALREGRPKAPAMHVHDNNNVTAARLKRPA